ncbi:hypothetical protein EN904_01430 [Mesorhizobium sp. M7A.F.Ca.CA.001.07.2.1]|uniref:hypothetical protein n=1 Tax=Mesorhizobium TaxID=68287 RepID=UPI000FCB7486|nr:MULTISPECIES: hypothetical protein [Mesorhizobium]RVB49216.1 hypothetical protein EN918_00615 [Mesorhizobium sp. M7A.F.Ca.CA.004.05.1.1]MCF6121619.1 hypothetical protein [Mesorhizobium ciceri]MCQ8812198.1 hypothetical protein [Mesorhizobium sp. SEMIA396]RUX81670.1 hypothetical protein EN983_03765 [Mesorhizobium sp. M7A.F.Ca.CA.004.08.2.1]RUX86868.1 hypothetical protein EN982_13225 [Mesorhizobium sp. M7A.F.Ca.CA.004.08.1.1]
MESPLAPAGGLYHFWRGIFRRMRVLFIAFAVLFFMAIGFWLTANFLINNSTSAVIIQPTRAQQ